MKPDGTEPAFTVSDGSYDDAGEAASDVGSGQHDGQPVLVAGGSTSRLGEQELPAARRRLGTGWTALAALVALIAVVAAASWHRERARPRVRTEVVTARGAATARLSGCLTDRPCAFDSLTDPGALQLVQQYLPDAHPLSASSVFDGNSGEFYRSLLVVDLPSGVLVSIEVQRDPTTAAQIPAWQSTLPSTGPADVELLVTGRLPGSSVAVSAHVPRGVAVPVTELQRLAADPRLQGR